MAAMTGHQKAHRGATDTWLTPLEIVRAVGPFDLDPCCPPVMPWETAGKMYHHPAQCGLTLPWFGRVWMNPPYGPETGRWLEKLASHGDGVAMVFARTETEMFHRWVWDAADAVLFLRGRVHFHHANGKRATANSGAPSVLVAYGRQNALRLKACGVAGRYVPLTEAA